MLRLNVDPDVDEQEVPTEFDGIPIEVVRIGGYEKR